MYRTLTRIATILALLAAFSLVVPMVASAHSVQSAQSSHTAVSGCKPVTVSQDFHKGPFHLVTANVAFTYCYNGSSAWLASGVHCWLSDIRDRATVSNITWCGTHEQNFTIGQNFTILIFVPSGGPVPVLVTFNGWLRAAPYGNGDMNTDWGGTITNIS